MQGRFRHWLTPGVQLVKWSRDWSGKVKCLEQAIQALIITIAISSNVIGALAASFFHVSFCTALIGQHNWTVGFNRIPVIGQLKQRIILSSVS